MASREQVTDEETRRALGSVPLFAELPEALRRQIAAQAELVRLPAGEWLFRQGDEGDAMYVVLSGRLEVVSEEPPPPVVLQSLTRQAIVGELALLTDSPRSAAVRARRQAELLRVSRRQVLRLLEHSPEFAVALTRALGLMLQRRSRPAVEPRPPVGVLAVAPLAPGVPCRPLSDRLVESLRSLTSVTLLDGTELDMAGRAPSEEAAAYGRLLDQREREFDLVVLLVDPGAAAAGSVWSRFCLQQADRVLAVAGTGAAAGGPTASLPDAVDCDLVVLAGPEDAERVPSVAATVRPRARHVLPQGSGFRPGVERLARRLLGRSVGLVLSGGGAGGLAHIGVLERLLATGVQIDRVGGTSFGAFVGALVAIGRSPAEILEICRREMVQRTFGDWTVPRVSLIRAERARAMLQRVFGDTRIEELPVDFFCVTADLLTAELVVHRHGELWEAVGASMSLPGLVPPMVVDGRLLVDGGVLDNLPVDVMAATGEGPIIAVDILRRKEVGGPGPPALPGIAETLSRVTVLGSRRTAARNLALAELVIAPDVSAYPMLGWRHIDALVEIGRSAADVALDQHPLPEQ